MAFLEGDTLVVFYHLSISEIWPDKSGGLWYSGSGLLRGRQLYLRNIINF